MPQDNQINYNVKVRLDPNTQGADSSVIYDLSSLNIISPIYHFSTLIIPSVLLGVADNPK